MKYLFFDWIKYLVCQEMKDLNAELLILSGLGWPNGFWTAIDHLKVLQKNGKPFNPFGLGLIGFSKLFISVLLFV